MKNVYWILLALLALVSGLFAGRGCSTSRTEVIEVTSTDTVTVTRIDTVVVERPTPVKVVEKRTDTLTVYRGTDTLYVPVPIRQYSFRDSLYSLDVSGFNVTLDRLEVYPRTVCRTITNTVTEKTPPRWALTLGPGVGYGPRGAQPYIGVSFGFVLWSK